MRTNRYRQVLFTVCFLLFTVYYPLFTISVFAQDDALRLSEKKRTELSEKEEALKQEDERLKALRKDVDERIDKYTKVLSRIEEALKTLETAKNERMEHLVKSYEAMPNEEAAARLSALDESTAVKIMLKMKSKKAGAVMASMDPGRAAAITEAMLSTTKKFPAR